jgi:hypothetical protein
VFACLGKIKLKLKPKLNMKAVKPTKKTTKKDAPLTIAAPATVAVVAAPAKTAAAPTKVAVPVRSTTPPKTAAIIEAKIDVGFGNQLFLRGEGAGLSWDRGIPLECVDSKTWRLTVPAQEKLVIKLLLNDSVWAKGEDVAVTPGQRLEIAPAF